jgi:FtsZ-interacting cell division protein ZipA
MSDIPPPPLTPLSRVIIIVAGLAIGGFLFVANWTATRLENRHLVEDKQVKEVTEAYLQQAKEGNVPQPKSGKDVIVVTNNNGKTFFVTVQTADGAIAYTTRNREDADDGEPHWIFRAVMPSEPAATASPSLPASQPSPTDEEKTQGTSAS